MAQTIESFVGTSLDNAKVSPLHRRIIGLIAAGYFFDVIDFVAFGALVPFILQSKFATGAEVAAVGSATIFGMFIGTVGQGQFADRFGRRFIYQFNLLLFGVFMPFQVVLLPMSQVLGMLGLSNQPAHHIPFMFTHTGQHHRTQRRQPDQEAEDQADVRALSSRTSSVQIVATQVIPDHGASRNLVAVVGLDLAWESEPELHGLSVATAAAGLGIELVVVTFTGDLEVLLGEIVHVPNQSKPASVHFASFSDTRTEVVVLGKCWATAQGIF